MGLQKIVVLCVVLVAFGASVWYFTQNNFSGEDKGQQVQQSTERERTPEEGTFTGYGSVIELLERGESVTCEYRAEQDGNITEGVVYVDGARGRYSMQGSYESAADSGSFGAIVDGEVMYWWGEGMEGVGGMRMTLPKDQEIVTTPEQFTDRSNTMVSPDQNVAYDCDRWNVDASVFVPPSDIEFTDMDQMMQDMFENMPEGFEIPEGMPVSQ